MRWKCGRVLDAGEIRSECQGRESPSYKRGLLATSSSSSQKLPELYPRLGMLRLGSPGERPVPCRLSNRYIPVEVCSKRCCVDETTSNSGEPASHPAPLSASGPPRYSAPWPNSAVNTIEQRRMATVGDLRPPRTFLSTALAASVTPGEMLLSWNLVEPRAFSEYHPGNWSAG
jgi:hypothetical protein